MEYFEIYINAFKKITDYHTPAPRKEFNVFILFYFVLRLLIIFLLVVSSLSTQGVNSTSTNPLITFLQIIYFIHLFPLVALVKRRLLDVNPVNAGSVFVYYLVVIIAMFVIGGIIRIMTPAQSMVIGVSNFSVSNILSVVLFSLFKGVLGLILLVFYVFLMQKQGNIGRE